MSSLLLTIILSVSPVSVETFRSFPASFSLSPTATTTATNRKRSLQLANNHEKNSQPNLSVADKDRLVMGETGLTAFIVAEMQHFVNETVTEFDQGLRFDAKWKMPLEDKLQMGLATALIKVSGDDDDDDDDDDDEGVRSNNQSIILDEEYTKFCVSMTSAEAVDYICNVTQIAFQEGFSSVGSSVGTGMFHTVF